MKELRDLKDLTIHDVQPISVPLSSDLGAHKTGPDYGIFFSAKVLKSVAGAGRWIGAAVAGRRLCSSLPRCTHAHAQ